MGAYKKLYSTARLVDNIFSIKACDRTFFCLDNFLYVERLSGYVFFFLRLHTELLYLKKIKWTAT